MAKSKLSKQVIDQLTCASCGLINNAIAQCCPACGYILSLNEENQPKQSITEEANIEDK